MAYIGMEAFEVGSRIVNLGDVTYDSGSARNLLGAVKYDDGGRLRALLGDDYTDFPTDLPLPMPADPYQAMPIEYAPPTPSPIVTTQDAPITGGLIPPAPIPQTAGTVIPTNSPVPAVASVTNAFANLIKSIFGSTSAAPATAGTSVLTPAGQTMAAQGQLTASWWNEATILSGTPNWEVVLGGGVLGLGLMAALSGGGGRRRRNPSRRNPMELILMGANPGKKGRRGRRDKVGGGRWSEEYSQGRRDAQEGKPMKLPTFAYKTGYAKGKK